MSRLDSYICHWVILLNSPSVHCASVHSTATPQPVMELANSALDSLELTWTVSSAMDVSSYTVYWSEVPSGAGGSRTLGNDSMQASIPDLLSNTAYMITVQAAGPLGKMDSTAMLYYTAPRGKNAVSMSLCINHAQQ